MTHLYAGTLVKVTEARPGSPGNSDDTFYAYNAFDKLTQCRIGGAIGGEGKVSREFEGNEG